MTYAAILTSAGPLILLDGYQTPAAIRRMGVAHLTRWLRARGVRSPEEFAATAVEAADQHPNSVALLASHVERLSDQAIHIPGQNPILHEVDIPQSLAAQIARYAEM
ncbi:hypothetical protein [Streptomyces sp. BE133]|uniref:hypothetical protein n=1 Tax=Streptomyces sp. BE133 TaxID=3002523 RepID=UPI002E7A8EC1|nr:hypothetical protein [Streptomyces sp. BE133]MEE1806869.1 hypothetical protein [Streptomyces sp. BE133]